MSKVSADMSVVPKMQGCFLGKTHIPTLKLSSVPAKRRQLSKAKDKIQCREIEDGSPAPCWSPDCHLDEFLSLTCTNSHLS